MTDRIQAMRQFQWEHKHHTARTFLPEDLHLRYRDNALPDYARTALRLEQALETEEQDPAHRLEAQMAEDEMYVSAAHPMSKDHYLSFIAYMTPDSCEIKVLYPEGNAEARFFFRRSGWLYYYCNRHGLFRQRLDIREMKKL